jgi:hypothetical protein
MTRGDDGGIAYLLTYSPTYAYVIPLQTANLILNRPFATHALARRISCSAGHSFF